MNLNLKFSHFQKIHKRGYSLDIIFLLKLVKEDQSIDLPHLCKESAKLQALYQGVIRKGLLSESGKITLLGQSILDFVNEEDVEDVTLPKKKNTDTEFDLWWKAYPGTDTFTYKGKSFTGNRSLRVRKEECKLKLEKILEEGEYSIEEIIAALEYEVIQKKDNSVKSGSNKLIYMQNSLTYLNQRTFEPFIELVKEGKPAVDNNIVPSGSTDI